MAELIPRSRRDHYVLVRPLGRGGNAETWLARREGGLFPDEVCIKRPLRHLNHVERRALLEEARLLARIRHANVVQLLDALEDEAGEVFLALELVRGVDLRVLTRGLARRGRGLRPAVIAVIGTCLCRALGAAQRAVPEGIVHRDVTPHNVLVSREGEVKLADFGIARAFDREQWTRAGLVKGKAGFFSPEQLRGEVLDVRSDLFAVGVVLYELLLGQRPILESAGAAEANVGACAELLARRLPALPLGLIDTVASLLSAFTDEQGAIDELRRNVADACSSELIEVSGSPNRS